MAQIKKYKEGDKVSKLGKLVWNGEELSSDQFIAFKNWAAKNSSTVGNVASEMIKAVESGKTISYDPVKRTVTGLPDVNAYSERANKRIHKNRISNIGDAWDNLTNSDRKQFANQIWAIGDWTPAANVVPTAESAKEKEKEKRSIAFTNRTVDYNPTETERYMQTSNNAAILSLIDTYTEYLNDADRANNWTITGNDARRKEIDAFYLANPERLAAYKAAIQAGVLDNETIQNLKNDLLITAGNYVKPQEVIKKEEEKKVGDQQQALDSFNPDVWKQRGITFAYDENGNLVVTGADKDKLYYLSDWSGVSSENPYYLGALLNNKFYSQQDLIDNVDNIQDQFKQAAELARAGKWDQLNALKNIEYFYESPAPFTVYDRDATYFAPFHDILKDNSQYIYLNPSYNLPENTYGIAHFDPNDTNTKYDAITGMPELTYSTYNVNTGNRTSDPYSQIGLDAKLNLNPDSWDYNVPIRNLEYSNGTAYGFVRGIGGTPNAPMYSIYKNLSDGQLYLKFKDGVYYKIEDANLYKKLITEGGLNAETVDNMIANKIIYDSNKEYRSKGNLAGNILTLGKGVNLSGIAKDKPLPALSSTNGLVYYQYGGSLSNIKKTTTGAGVHTKNDQLRDIRKENAKLDEEWTRADELEFAAILTDVGSTIASLVPGANVGAAIASIGATGTQFAADVTRDGFDFGDVGRGLSGLALDAITFLPFAGAGAKAIKVARSIRKGANVLGKIFAIKGLAEATAALKNVISGEYDMSDIRKIAVGIQSSVGLGKSASRRWDKATLGVELAKQTKLANNKFPLVGKIGDKKYDIELTEEDVAGLTKSIRGGKQQTDKINELIATKLKEKFPDLNIEDKKNLYKIFGVSTNIRGNAVLPVVEKTDAFTESPLVNFLNVKGLDRKFNNYDLSKDIDLNKVYPNLKAKVVRGLDDQAAWNPERFKDLFIEGEAMNPFTGKMYTTYKNDRIKYFSTNSSKKATSQPSVAQPDAPQQKTVAPTAPAAPAVIKVDPPKPIAPQQKIVKSEVPDAPKETKFPEISLPSLQSLLKTPFILPKGSTKGLTYESGKYLPDVKGQTDVFTHSTMPATRNLPSPYVWHFAHQPKPKIIPTKIIIVDAIDPNAPKQTAQSILGLPYTQQLMLPEQGTINVAGFKKGGKLVQKAKAGLPSLGGINTLDSILYPTLTKPKSLYSSNVPQYNINHTGDPNVDGIDMNDGQMLDEVVVTASKKKPDMSIDDSQTVTAANAWIDNFAKSLGIGKAPTVKETETTLKDAFGITPRSEITSALLPDLSKKYGHLQLSGVDAIKQYKGNSTKAKDDTDVGQEPKSNKFPLELALRSGKLITTISNNNKAHDQLKDSLRASAKAALQQGPTEIYDNFKMNPLLHAYKNAADNQRGMQFVGNDWTAIAAMQQQSNQQANMFDVEFAKELTGALDKHNATNLDARRNYAKGRADIANTNRGILSNLYGKLGEAEFSKDRNNATSIQNAFNEGLGMIQQEKQNQFGKNNMLFSQEVNEATRKARQEYLTGSGLQAQYDALDENERSSYGNILNWMEAKRKGQFQEYLDIKGSVTKDAVNDLYKPKETLLSRFLKLV